MNVLKKIWLDARLKRGLTRNGCRLDSGIQGLRGQVRLVLEHNVKLHDIKIYAPELHIGAYTDIVSGSELHDVSHIGRYCSIAGRVVIGQDPRSHPAEWLSTSHAMQKARFARQPRIDAPPAGEAKGPATVGHDVWIGRDVLIMKGVAIGTGAIIGARSVVTKDVPPYAIVVGSPARVVRYRFEAPARQALIASHWWEFQLGALADLAVESPLEFLRQLRSRSPLPVANVPRLEVTNDPLHIHFKAGVASEHQPADPAQRFAAPPAQGDVSQNAPG